MGALVRSDWLLGCRFMERGVILIPLVVFYFDEGVGATLYRNPHGTCARPSYDYIKLRDGIFYKLFLFFLMFGEYGRFLDNAWCRSFFGIENSLRLLEAPGWASCSSRQREQRTAISRHRRQPASLSHNRSNGKQGTPTTRRCDAHGM
jgi:hypothetical protein